MPFAGIGEGIAREAGLIAKGTRAANVGKGLGEMVGGLVQLYLGAGGTVGGGVVSASGLGAAVGVPVAVASATLAASGIANVAAGAANLWTALSKGGEVRRKPGSLGKFKGIDALRRENDVLGDVAQEMKLSRDQQSQLHREVSGEGLTYDEILELAKEMFAT